MCARFSAVLIFLIKGFKKSSIYNQKHLLLLIKENLKKKKKKKTVYFFFFCLRHLKLYEVKLLITSVII